MCLAGSDAGDGRGLELFGDFDLGGRLDDGAPGDGMGEAEDGEEEAGGDEEGEANGGGAADAAVAYRGEERLLDGGEARGVAGEDVGVGHGGGSRATLGFRRQSRIEKKRR